MVYGFNRGRGGVRGGGGGMGFGFRGNSPPWPYSGRGRGGLPRCGYYVSGVPAPRSYQPQSYSPRMTREGDLSYMKDHVEALRDKLRELETEIGKLLDERA